MLIEIDYQVAIESDSDEDIPEPRKIEQWIHKLSEVITQTPLLLKHFPPKTPIVSCAIRIVSEQEMCDLNATYRHKNEPTNVLSFPFDSPSMVPLAEPYLGDIAICAAIVRKEADELKELGSSKSLDAHWLHLIIHGVLHLVGFDHIAENDAVQMENWEIQLMESFGFPNPYMLN